jgi:predicted permease
MPSSFNFAQTASHFLQDLKYGARSLLRAPAFTAVTVLTLALGLGANTAVFSLVQGVLLRPLAYPDSDRLVTLLHDGAHPVSPANYLDWHAQTKSFDVMGAAQYWSPNILPNGSADVGPPEHLVGLQVTQSLFPMLRVAPVAGRFFRPGEEAKGAGHVVILSHRLWQRRFGGDARIVGKQLKLDNEGYTVIGVMPADFQFAPFWATKAELWVPLALGGRMHDREGNSLRVFARLKANTTLQQARADISAVTSRLEKEYPGTNRAVLVTPLKENVVGKVSGPLFVLLGAVGFVLLIACANVAHLFLARTADRSKEIALRIALGAARSRLVGQLLTESLLLSGLASCLGLLIAAFAIKALVVLNPAFLPRVDSVTIDPRVLFFLLAATLVTAVAFGLLPALAAGSERSGAHLKEGNRSVSDGLGRNRLRSVLVISEFALASMLLIGAGLMLRSFLALTSLNPGFNPDHVLSMIVSVSGTNEAQGNRRTNFYRELLQSVRAAPGVVAAGAINHLPLAGDLWGLNFSIEGRPIPQRGQEPAATYRVVMPGYFETMRLPVIRGRTISPSDDARSRGVVVINQQAARVYWRGQNPIGRRISFESGPDSLPIWLTIVGVSADAKQGDWAASPQPEVYLSMLQARDSPETASPRSAYLTLVVRLAGSPETAAKVIQKIVWSFDRNLPISEVMTMHQVVAQANAQSRFGMLLLSGFGSIALLLAAIGIYGVMNYSVSRRTREIGVRLSLGASPLEVLRMVLGQGMRQAVVGIVLGLLGSLWLSRLMRQMLYGVASNDPAAISIAVGILLLAAFVAMYVPARRAATVDPITALRSE